MENNREKLKQNEYIEEIEIRLTENKRLRTKYTYDCITNYITCLLMFGKKEPLTDDNLTMLTEIRTILRKEKDILKYIECNLEGIDFKALEQVLFSLFDANDNAMSYYRASINHIESSSLKSAKTRVKPPFDIEEQNKNLERQIIGLKLTEEDIRKWLQGPEEFWLFIEDKIRRLPISAGYEELEAVTGITYIKEHNSDVLASLRLSIPEIIDLQTALRALDIYYDAFIAFKNIGKEYKREKINHTNINQAFIEDCIDKKITTEIERKSL